MSSSQQRRQDTRDGGGRYATMPRGEAEVDLRVPGTSPTGRPALVQQMTDDDGAVCYAYEDGVVLRDTGEQISSFDADGTYRPHPCDPTTAHLAMTRLGVLPGEERTGHGMGLPDRSRMLADPDFQDYADRMLERHREAFDEDSASCQGKDPWSEQSLSADRHDAAFARRAGYDTSSIKARDAHAAAWTHDVAGLYEIDSVARAHREGVPRSKGARSVSSTSSLRVFTADVAGQHRTYTVTDDATFPRTGGRLPVSSMVDVTDIAEGYVAENNADPETIIGPQTKPLADFVPMTEQQLEVFDSVVPARQRTKLGYNAREAVRSQRVDGWSMNCDPLGDVDGATLVISAPGGRVDEVSLGLDDARRLGVEEITSDKQRATARVGYLERAAAADVEDVSEALDEAKRDLRAIYRRHRDALEANAARAETRILGRLDAAR